MPEPTKIPRPFADSGDKNSIPDSSGGLGFASWQEGFPAITGTPFAQGGVAPKRADFNGIFNALSAAVVWAQQGGVYAYDATTDYEIGNITEKSGIIYICETANGPSSAVKDPATDTTETYWARLYPQNGTFNRMFFSQTSGSYIAPYTGVYRITVKGGGGGGGPARTDANTCGGGGGEGGTQVFYVTLTKDQSYPYVIGAGGNGGTTGDSGTIVAATDGGDSSFNALYVAPGGTRGGNGTGGNGGYGGGGGIPFTPTNGIRIVGHSGTNGDDCRGLSRPLSIADGGGITNNLGAGIPAQRGGGGTGGGMINNTWLNGYAGASGYILIEYAG